MIVTKVVMHVHVLGGQHLVWCQESADFSVLLPFAGRIIAEVMTDIHAVKLAFVFCLCALILIATLAAVLNVCSGRFRSKQETCPLKDIHHLPFCHFFLQVCRHRTTIVTLLTSTMNVAEACN